MGSGGGRTFHIPKEDLKKEFERSIDNTKTAAFETTINDEINDILAEYNDRDSNTIQEHLNEIQEVIEEDIEGMIDLKFGGSINKYTYVEGLSDVDTLVTLNNSELSSLSPKDVLNYLKSKLDGKLKNLDNINVGELAVTLNFSNNVKIQILPAIKQGDGFKIPKTTKNEWSNLIKPKKFAEKLTQVNKNLNGSVIPVIKIVKGINSRILKDHPLKSYHIESIAIEAFKTYPDNKPKTPKALLKHFFEKAKDIVKKPIKDNTGQSIHVDEYLKSENSKERSDMSYALNRIYKKMEKADKLRSVSEWSKILGE
jgi:hypothetical protein